MVKGSQIWHGKVFTTHFNHTITSSQDKNALMAQAGSFGIRLWKKPLAMTDRNFAVHWGIGSMMTTLGNGSIILDKINFIAKWGMDGSFGLLHKEGDVADSTGTINLEDNQLIQSKDYIEPQSINTMTLCS
jgi:hypothetical protein